MYGGSDVVRLKALVGFRRVFSSFLSECHVRKV
jgi:hypothetical protein